MLSPTNTRLAAARQLTTRKHRRESGRFLAEGAPAVREALAADAVIELFATAAAIDREAELLAGRAVDEISPKDAAALSQTSTPQGLIAVCRQRDAVLAAVLERHPRLIAALIEPNDPGNAGTILRTADAAGADAVVICGGVDIYNPKAVRASAGSLFHLDVVTEIDAQSLVADARAAGLTVLATTGAGSRDLDGLAEDATLEHPTLWLFGNEAHGLPAPLIDGADLSVRVPIHGRAESLNLAAAAAICLYASASAIARAEQGGRGKAKVRAPAP